MTCPRPIDRPSIEIEDEDEGYLHDDGQDD
jgi:hypothetical protein